MLWRGEGSSSSLGTNDRKRASLRAAELRIGLMREWERKLGCPGLSIRSEPSGADLQRAATAMGYVGMRESVAHWWADVKSDDDHRHERFIEQLELRRKRYIERRETSDLGLWRYAADAVLTENAWSLSDAQSRDRFAQMIAEAVIDGLRVQIEIKNGDFGAEPRSKMVRAGLQQI
jgi:hypothetical protein